MHPRQDTPFAFLASHFHGQKTGRGVQLAPQQREASYLIILLGTRLMESVWRKHLVICLLLGLLAIPIYFLDVALNKPGRASGNWIILNFQGFIFWTYIALLAIQVVLSSTALLSFPRLGALSIHLGSMLLSLILLVAGLFIFSKLHDWAVFNQYRALMESRRSRINVIELKKWWYFPDEVDPTEIRVKVIVRESGRFAGNVKGEQIDPSGSSTIVFESINQPESQRQVGSGETFTYVFPLKTLHAVHANDVRITLYLFKVRSGPSTEDITKVFMNSPQQADDGEYFYGALPPASRPAE